MVNLPIGITQRDIDAHLDGPEPCGDGCDVCERSHVPEAAEVKAWERRCGFTLTPDSYCPACGTPHAYRRGA